LKEQIANMVLSVLPRAIMNRLVGDFVPIFMLHSMVDHNNEPDHEGLANLKVCLEYVRKKNYTALSLDEFFNCIAEQKKLPKNHVVFTADDGYSDQFKLIAPVFSSCDIPLTCFVVTDFIDGKMWLWDAQVDFIINTTNKKSFDLLLPNGENHRCEINIVNKNLARRKLVNRLKEIDQTNIHTWLNDLYQVAEVDVPKKIPAAFKAANWDEIETFCQQGHIVAPHSLTHPILSQICDKDAEHEIVESHIRLKKKIPNCSNVFAYPSGRDIDFGLREEQIIQKSELVGAVSAIPGHATESQRLSCVSRYGMPNNLFDFMQYLSYIEVLKSKLRWK